MTRPATPQESPEIAPQQPFPWLMLLVCGLLLYAASIYLRYTALPIRIGDTDDALRLVQVRQFIAGGGWFDMHIPRLAPPDGYVSHWSRLPDAVMAALYAGAALVLPPAQAETFMRAAYPGLWIFLAFSASVAMAYRLVPHRLAVTGLLMLIIGSPGTFPQFAAGRIDHHGAQIALSVAALAAAALADRSRLSAVLAGLFTALGLAIGLEALPLLLVPAAAIGLRYVAQPQGRAALQTYAASLAVSAMAMLALAYPPSAWGTAVCDALAANLVAAIVSACLVLLAWAQLKPLNRTWPWRAAGGALAVGAAAMAYIALNPDCLHGPFAAVGPAIKARWLANVVEMQPLLTGNQGALANLPLVLFAVPVAAAMLWLLSMPKHRTYTFLTVCAGFVASTAIGLSALRMSVYIIWFAAPVLFLAAFELFTRLGPRRRAIAALLVAVLSPAVLGMGTARALNSWNTPTATMAPASGAAASIAAPASCNHTSNFAAMAQLPPGLVMAEVDLGSYILALTPHSVFSAPYHRIGQRVIDTLDFLSTSDMAWAKDYVRLKGFDYIAICNNGVMPVALGDNPGLYTAILEKRLPDWLTPVSVQPGNPIEVYAVKK